MAALLLAKNDASAGPVDREGAALTSAIANTAIPRPSSVRRKRYIMPLCEREQLLYVTFQHTSRIFRRRSSSCRCRREREARARLLLVIVQPPFCGHFIIQSPSQQHFGPLLT